MNGTTPIAAANAVVSGGKKLLESMQLDNGTHGKDELIDLPHFDSVVYIFWSVNIPPSSSLYLVDLSFLALAVRLLVWHLF